MCGNYIASIGCVARLWADDDENHRFPTNFICMSNELCMTKILICPGDRSRTRATNWESLTPENCSYEIMAPGMADDEKAMDTMFLRCKYHGHLGYGDATVFDGKRRRSKL